MKMIVMLLMLAAGCIDLLAFEFELINKTPFEINKLQVYTDDSKNKKEITEDIDISLAMGHSQKISLPEKHKESDLRVFFKNGHCEDLGLEIVELGKVRSITMLYKDTFSILYGRRGKKTKIPVGQIKIDFTKKYKVTLIAIRPIDLSDEWKKLEPITAGKNLYAVPTDKKYMLKFETSHPNHPICISKKKGEGYDFAKYSSISLKYIDYDCNVDEAD